MGKDNILYISSLFILSPPVLLSPEIQQTSDQKIWFLILQRQEERTSNNFFFSQVICSWRCWCCPNRVCLEIVDYFYFIYLFMYSYLWLKPFSKHRNKLFCPDIPYTAKHSNPSMELPKSSWGIFFEHQKGWLNWQQFVRK